MSLAAICSLKSARRKLFMNPTQNMCKNLNQTFLGLERRNESNSHQLARIGEKKIFRENDAHHC